MLALAALLFAGASLVGSVREPAGHDQIVASDNAGNRGELTGAALSGSTPGARSRQLVEPPRPDARVSDTMSSTNPDETKNALNVTDSESAQEPSDALPFADTMTFAELANKIRNEAVGLDAIAVTVDDAEELCPGVRNPAIEMEPVDEEQWEIEVDGELISVRFREFLSVRRTVNALTGTTRSWRSCSDVVFRSDNQVRRESSGYRSINRHPGARLVETFHEPNSNPDEAGFESDRVMVGSKTSLLVAVDKWLIEVKFDSFAGNETDVAALEERAEELVAAIETVLLSMQ